MRSVTIIRLAFVAQAYAVPAQTFQTFQTLSGAPRRYTGFSPRELPLGSPGILHAAPRSTLSRMAPRSVPEGPRSHILPSGLEVRPPQVAPVAPKAPNGRQAPSLKGLDGVFYDLDDCLYNMDGVGQYQGKIAVQFLMEEVGFTPEQMQAFKKMAKNGMSAVKWKELGMPKDKLAELITELTNGIPYKELIPPNPDLRTALLAVPGPRFVMTNNLHGVAERILDVLGVSDLFTGVIAVDDLNSPWTDDKLVVKPEVDFYKRAMSSVGVRHGMMIDDRDNNIMGAMDAGMFAVQMAGYSSAKVESSSTDKYIMHPEYDIPVITNLNELPAVIEDYGFSTTNNARVTVTSLEERTKNNVRSITSLATVKLAAFLVGSGVMFAALRQRRSVLSIGQEPLLA